MRLGLVAGFLMSCLLACGPSTSADDDDDDDDDATGAVDAARQTDGRVDADGDGYSSGVGGDCDDTDENVYPGATELCTNEIDDDCDDAVDQQDIDCAEPCDRAAATDSYLGCEFYSIDLPQADLSRMFGISVSNPSATETATVTVSNAAGELDSFTVGPRMVGTYTDAIRAMNVSSPGLSDKVYRIDSDLPIAAYQFNSIDTIGAATTDASLLFASHTLANRYYVMDYTGADENNNFIAVYATQPNTQVTIEPTTPVHGTTSTTLQPMQVLVVTARDANVDLTGSRVEADKPVGVFGGNSATNVPVGVLYRDHLEQQIFPRQAIGTSYVVGKSHGRTHCNAEDYVRVLADTDNTTVTFDPPVLPPQTLAAGEWVETSITENVEVASTEAVMVGQFLRSSNAAECQEEGDPAFMLQVPVAQFRRDYVFLTPATYDRDFVDITAPLGATVVLDGLTLVLDSTAVGGTGHSVTSVVLEDGSHVVEADQPIGIMVYGYGGPAPEHSSTQNVSYGYPGGLDLAAINPVE